MADYDLVLYIAESMLVFHAKDHAQQRQLLKGIGAFLGNHSITQQNLYDACPKIRHDISCKRMKR